MPLFAEWEEWLLTVLQRRPKGELLNSYGDSAGLNSTNGSCLTSIQYAPNAGVYSPG